MAARLALVNESDHAVIGLLRSRGLRPTRARRLILARLRRSNDHLSADEVRRELRRRGHVVSIATLYQNLKALTEAGLLASFADSAGLVRFDANTEPHDHLVCTRCGRIEDVAPARAPRPARHLHSWVVTEARLELRGRCPRCRRQEG
jgi:Fur family transcriptional regulator, peroxide stress response regulator